ncbi:hypothetical protein PX52LOC_08020 [Limnoglobus roseus]|uniref:Uncharacterized protein n=1 Tax=Limnoglobus roseus TaxID=2598579 RepID=A0A5C1ANB5_9BACT|nr:hypothetical protein PX52LOC_08020 [Limnoglobus roseus]
MVTARPQGWANEWGEVYAPEEDFPPHVLSEQPQGNTRRGRRLAPHPGTRPRAVTAEIASLIRRSYPKKAERDETSRPYVRNNFLSASEVMVLLNDMRCQVSIHWS